MKPVKSIVLLAAGALVLSGCDMKKKGNQTTTMDTPTTTSAAPMTTSEPVVVPPTHSTEAGSGAVSDQAIREDELHPETEAYDDKSMNNEVEEQEAYPDTIKQGTGAGDYYEYVDETSSEPDHVRGGRDARMVPKNNQIDNTSSEPDIEPQ